MKKQVLFTDKQKNTLIISLALLSVAIFVRYSTVNNPMRQSEQSDIYQAVSLYKSIPASDQVRKAAAANEMFNVAAHAQKGRASIRPSTAAANVDAIDCMVAVLEYQAVYAMQTADRARCSVAQPMDLNCFGQLQYQDSASSEEYMFRQCGLIN